MSILMFMPAGNYRKWGENMRKWCEILENKKIKCLLIGLLAMLAVALISATLTVKKSVAARKEPIVSNAGESQTFAMTGGERIRPVSRGGDTDRYSVYILARVIEGEAADEPYEGKVAVGAVIVNRCENREFPNSVPGVINQMGAFESVSNGQYQRPLSGESMRAAVEALGGNDPSGGSLYFWNPSKTSNKWVWSRPVVKQIGNHVFAR